MLQNFKVIFPHCETIVVQAKDRDSAWAAYKKICGIVGSIHKPQILLTQEPVTNLDRDQPYASPRRARSR